MTKRERFLAFASFEAVDRPPRYADFTDACRQRLTAHLKRTPEDAFDMDHAAGAGLRPPAGFVPPNYAPYYPGHTAGENSFSIDGNGVGHVNHGYYHFTEHVSPLRDATRFEELERYPIVDNADWLDDQMIEACRTGHAAGRHAQVFVGHMYEDAWQVRGYEAFLMDLLTQRDWAEYLLDRYCRNNVRSAAAAARAGYDCLACGDDVANQNALMFQPDLWRAVMKPRWARVFAAARREKPDIHIWYHSDGNVTDILDDLVEIGVTILNPVQPECMDPAGVRRRFGRRLAFDGCVGTQTTFPFGTPADMRRAVQELAAHLHAGRGGLMLSPTHVLEPEVPPENIVAFFEACDGLETNATRSRKQEAAPCNTQKSRRHS